MFPLATIEHTLFFVLGITLVVSAVVLAVVGLRFESFPPNRMALAGVVLYFVALVGGTTTFAVLNAAQEQNAEQAAATTTSPSTSPTSTTPSGAGSTVKIAADPSGQLTYVQSDVTAPKAGAVKIDFTNQSPLSHNVTVEDSNGKVLGATDTITGSSTTATVNLKPGKYTFLCTVDGHAQAGMKGTLTVK